MNIKSSFDEIRGNCGYWRLNMTGLSSPAVARVKFAVADVRRGGGVR